MFRLTASHTHVTNQAATVRKVMWLLGFCGKFWHYMKAKSDCLSVIAVFYDHNNLIMKLKYNGWEAYPMAHHLSRVAWEFHYQVRRADWIRDMQQHKQHTHLKAAIYQQTWGKHWHFREHAPAISTKMTKLIVHMTDDKLLRPWLLGFVAFD